MTVSKKPRRRIDIEREQMNDPHLQDGRGIIAVSAVIILLYVVIAIVVSVV